MSSNLIDKPAVRTWWISKVCEEPCECCVFCTGVVEPNQVLTSSHKSVETFIDAEAYAKRLSELEVKIDPYILCDAEIDAELLERIKEPEISINEPEEIYPNP